MTCMSRPRMDALTFPIMEAPSLILVSRAPSLNAWQDDVDIEEMSDVEIEEIDEAPKKAARPPKLFKKGFLAGKSLAAPSDDKQAVEAAAAKAADDDDSDDDVRIEEVPEHAVTCRYDVRIEEVPLRAVTFSVTCVVPVATVERFLSLRAVARRDAP